MPFTTVPDLTGNMIVLSGAVGELPEKYAEVSISTRNGCPLLVVENTQEQAGVIDLQGNVVVPMDGAYDDIYDLDISSDGTLVVGYNSDRNYVVYNFAAEEAEAAPVTGVNSVARPKTDAAASTGSEAEEQPAQDGSWTCACGSVNSGKFCPECGAAKPAGCPECGAAAAETAKFCSECGASLKPAE